MGLKGYLQSFVITFGQEKKIAKKNMCDVFLHVYRVAWPRGTFVAIFQYLCNEKKNFEKKKKHPSPTFRASKAGTLVRAF